jgi:dihydrofolate reductase
MRKLIYSMMVSLDGYIEDVNHKIDWHIIDEELHQFINDQQAEVDTFLYGRRMYENMASFWPTADEDPSNPSFVVEWARIWKNMPKIVFSKTLENVKWNSRLVREVIPEEIHKLKAQPGKALSVGGATIAADFIKQNLIDEYQLFVQPVILGGGRPFFPALENRIRLRLVETRKFSSGVYLLCYQVDKSIKK